MVVASVAALLALVGFALVHFSRSEQILFAAPLLGDLSAKALLCLFLTIWWAVGMYVITFIAPFTSTGNGYFAVWIGFACGIASVGATLPRLKASAPPSRRAPASSSLARAPSSWGSNCRRGRIRATWR